MNISTSWSIWFIWFWNPSTRSEADTRVKDPKVDFRRLNFEEAEDFDIFRFVVTDLQIYLLFGCRTTKIATSNDWHQSPLHGAWHNLIDAKCRWRSNRLDGAGGNRELLGQRKEMKIHQVAITHDICCYTAQFKLRSAAESHWTEILTCLVRISVQSDSAADWSHYRSQKSQKLVNIVCERPPKELSDRIG